MNKKNLNYGILIRRRNQKEIIWYLHFGYIKMFLDLQIGEISKMNDEMIFDKFNF